VRTCLNDRLIYEWHMHIRGGIRHTSVVKATAREMIACWRVTQAPAKPRLAPGTEADGCARPRKVERFYPTENA
jgi:hypothetical protein